MNKAVFLDRDGVLNRAIVRGGKPYPPSCADELEILPGAVEACRALKNENFLLAVVTNQPDVARGTQTRESVEALNEILRRHIPLDGIFVCYHDDSDKCACRKPLPGLLLSAAREWQVNLSASFMVGDRWRDIEAGRGAGCRTVLIDYHYDEKMRSLPDHQVSSIEAAAQWILEQSR